MRAIMRAIAVSGFGIAGILISTKPSADSFGATAASFKQRLINKAMKRSDLNETNKFLFGGVIEYYVNGQVDVKYKVYDYVFCKIGIMHFDMLKDGKPHRDSIYAWGLINGWVMGNQEVMKSIIAYNASMFRNTFDKIPLE